DARRPHVRDHGRDRRRRGAARRPACGGRRLNAKRAQRARPTTFGLSLFGHRPEEHVPLCVAAEAAGWGGGWLGEHVAAPQLQRPGLYHEADIIRDDTELYDIWTV